MTLPSISRISQKIHSSLNVVQLIFIVLLTFLVAGVLGGCAALQVSHRSAGSTNATTSVPGIPFYEKKARCRQEVVWFEPIYTLTLTALIPDKDGVLQSHPRGTVVLSRSKFMSPEVVGLVKFLNNGPTDVGTVTREWQKLIPLIESNVLSRDFSSLTISDRILLGRSAAPSVYVDYSEQYYVNAKVPLSGSANVDAKVAEDGSLSEASGQVEDKTLDTILGALPISSVITGGLGLSSKGVSAGAGEVEAFQLATAVSGYRHTLARLVDFPTASTTCSVATDIPFVDGVEYKREDITAPVDSGKDAKGSNSEGSTTKDQAAGKKNTKQGTNR